MARKLIVEVIGDASSLDAALGKSAAAATGFVGKLKASSAEMAAAGASLTRNLTLPLAAIGVAGTKMAVDFQASMELLHTQAGVSQKAVESLSKSVLGMAGDVATTPETLSTGLYHLASQGLRGAQALDALRVAAEGAKIGGANLEDVTNALGAVVVSGIKGSQDFERAMGQLNATVGAGDMHMQDLADAMGTGLPAKAAVAGVSLRDVSAALAVFGDNNIRGAEAGTLLNSTIRLMEGPSNASAKAMAAVGLSAKDLGDTLRNQGLVAAIELLQQKLGGLSKTEQFQALTHMFGGRQSGGVLVLMDQLERLKTKVKEVDDGGNKFAADWDAYTQTTAYKMDQLGASMSSAGISIGNILLPFVSKAVNALSEVAAKFQALPGPVKDFAVGVGLAVAVVGPLISTIGKLGEALTLLATNPVILVVAALVAVGAAMAAAVLAPQKLQQALEGLGLSAGTSARVVHDLQEAFGYLQVAAGAVEQAIRNHWGQIEEIIQGLEQIVTGVVNVVEAVWSRFGSNITAFALNTWNLVKATIQNALNVIQGVVEIFAGILHGNWSEAWAGVKEIVSAVSSEIGAILRAWVSELGNLADAAGKAIETGMRHGGDAALSFMQSLPSKLVHALGDLGSLLVDAGKALMEGLGKGIEDGLGDVLHKVEDVGGKIKSTAKSVLHVFSPSRDFIEIGQQLMAGLAVGVDTGSPEAVKALKKSLDTAKAALDANQPLVEEAARLLGAKATQGIVDGALGVQQTAREQLRQALEQAMAPALAEEAAAPAISAASERLGASAVQKIVDGVVGKQPTLAQQIRISLAQAMQQGIQQAQQDVQTFKSDFSSLASSILSAFDQAHANFVSPAQKQLNAMQLQDQVAQYQQAVDQAKTTLAADQDALNQAMSGGDPAAIKAAQAQVISDQQAFDAAVRQQKEFQLQQLAAKQDDAHAANVAKEREALAKRLVELEKGLSKEPAQWDTMGKQVQKILKAYDVPMFQSGQRFASQFADGISSQLSAVEASAKAMAEAVSKYIPKSPAKTGPLAFSSLAMGRKFALEFSQGISQGLYAGAGMTNVAAVFGSSTRFGSLGLGAASTLTGATGGGVNVTVPVTVHGSLVGSTPREIADELKYPIRDALLTIARSEPSIFRGRA